MKSLWTKLNLVRFGNSVVLFLEIWSFKVKPNGKTAAFQKQRHLYVETWFSNSKDKLTYWFKSKSGLGPALYCTDNDSYCLCDFNENIIVDLQQQTTLWVWPSDYGQRRVISRPGGMSSTWSESHHNIYSVFMVHWHQEPLQQHCKMFNHQESHNSSRRWLEQNNLCAALKTPSE